MRISELCKELYKKGLDIDGSRETLIATLKEANEEDYSDIDLSKLTAQMEEEDDDSNSSGDDSDASSDSDV